MSFPIVIRLHQACEKPSNAAVHQKEILVMAACIFFIARSALGKINKPRPPQDRPASLQHL